MISTTFPYITIPANITYSTKTTNASTTTSLTNSVCTTTECQELDAVLQVAIN